MKKRGDKMQPVGFVLFCIGIALVLAAKRIVMGKVKLNEQDKSEFEFLATGGIIAVRVAGFIVALMGVLFLLL